MPKIVSKTVVRSQDSLQSYDRVRSAVGGHARAEESTKVLERRRGRGWCGCVGVAGGGDQKQPQRPNPAVVPRAETTPAWLAAEEPRAGDLGRG